MVDAPEAVDHWPDGQGLRLLNEKRRVRAVIGGDGEVKDGTGRTLAYIEANGEVGSHEMDFLGCVHERSGQARARALPAPRAPLPALPPTRRARAPRGHAQVINRDDEALGEFDSGRGYVKNATGSVVAEINKEGVVSGNHGMTVGAVEGCAAAAAAAAAAARPPARPSPRAPRDRPARPRSPEPERPRPRRSFTFDHMARFAAYVLLIDPAYVAGY